jgi:large repetitive protein
MQIREGKQGENMVNLSMVGARAPRRSLGAVHVCLLLLLCWLGLPQQALAACAPTQTARVPSGGQWIFSCSPAGFDNVRSNGAPGENTIHGTVDTGSSFNLIYTNNGDGATSASFLANDDGGQTITFNITVDPPAPTITAPDAPTITSLSSPAGAVGSPASVTVSFNAPSNNGGQPITGYTVTSSPDNITATGTGSPITVTGLARGTAYTFTMTASNGTYTSAPSSPAGPLTSKAYDTVTLSNPGRHTFGTALTMSASAASGRPVTFASTTPAVCMIHASNGQVTVSQAGDCSITASVPENGTYLAASQTQTFPVDAVAPDAPVMGVATTSPSSANQTTGMASVSFSPPVSNGGSPIVSYTVSSIPVGVSVVGSGSPLVITGLDLGTTYQFQVTASNNAATSVASASSNAITPTRQQAITFHNPGSVYFGTTTPLNVSSTSGLPVTVTSSTPTCDIIAGNQVRARAPGQCVLLATQNGDSANEPAPPVEQRFQVRVPGGEVSIDSTSLPSPTRGVPYSQTLVVTGGAQPYSYQLSGLLPNGMVFNNGTFSGTPTQGGTYAFTVTVTDQAGQSATRYYTLSVISLSIVITPVTLPVGKVGVAYPGTMLTATGGIAPYVYAVTAGTLPDGITLSPVGTLSGTPRSASALPVTITATDNFGATGSQAYTFTVGEATPVAVDDTATAASNTAVTIPVTTNDTGGPTSSIALAQAPTHGTAVVSGLNVVYTPAHDFFGTDTFTYTGTGPGGTSGTATVTITVAPGAVPTVIAQTATVLAGQPVTIAGAQGAANGPFTAATVVDAPATGTVQVQGTDFIYTPAADASGDVAFTYTVSNVFGASQPATITVTVNPLPVAAPVVASAAAGRSLRVNLSAGARGGPFTAANVVSVSPANAGTARIESAADGLVMNFEAAAAFGGVAQIGFTLSNAYATSATGYVSITVTARPDPSKDTQVLGVLSAQADATRRMATGQISNFQRRLEQLRSGAPGVGFSNGITLNAASARPMATLEERERGQGPNAENLSAHGDLEQAVDTSSATGSTGGLLPGGVSVWTGGAINFGKAGESRGDASTDFTTSGLSIGADRVFAKNLILGAGVGYGRDDTDVGDHSRSKADSYSAAVYASYRPADAFFIDTLLGYQWLSLESLRAVTDSDARVSGSRDGTQWFGSLSLGYILRSKDVQFTPYARYDLAKASLDSFTERGDELHALSYQAQTVDTSTLSAGVLAQFAVARDYGVWSPQLRAEYGRSLEGASSAWMSYADLVGSGNVYRASLLQRSRDRGLLGVGLGLQTLGRWNLLLEYQVELDSSSGDNQSVRVGIEKKFDR